MMRAAALVLLLSATAIRAQDLPALHSVSGVAADDVLNVREDPSAASAIIGALAPDATGIEVILVTGGWAMVNTEDRFGYVALRFLTPDPAPPWYTLDLPLTCFGTEPFWSLTVDPAAGQTRFSTPEAESAQTADLDRTWPGEPWAPAAAVAIPQGLLVVRPAECSDGMSERAYGLAADIFLDSGDHQRLSGCCTLETR